MKKTDLITVTLEAGELYKILHFVSSCDADKEVFREVYNNYRFSEKWSFDTKYETRETILKAFWVEWAYNIKFEEDIKFKEYTVEELEKKLWEKIKIIK